MIHKAKDLSPDQKTLLEGLLVRSISENDVISVRAISADSSPDWLQASWDSAKRIGVDQLSIEEIDAEIEAARKDRWDNRQLTEQ